MNKSIKMILLVSLALSSPYVLAECIGYSGPGGPCYTGLGGGIYTAPGGAYTGPGGAYTGPGGAYTGPGGAYTGPGGAYTGPGGAYTGPGGAYDGPGGAYTGPGGAYSGDPCNSGPGASSYDQWNRPSPHCE